MQRLRDERDRFVNFAVEDVESWPQPHRFMGRAKFVSEHELLIYDGEDMGTRIAAERFVIATGSRPNIMPTLQNLGKRLIVNDDIFYWQDLPKSIAVLVLV